MVGDATHLDGRPAEPTTRPRRRLVGALTLVLLAGIAASGCSASSDVTATTSPTAVSGTNPGKGAGTTTKVGAGVGSLVPDPDHPGELITIDGDPTTTTTTTAAGPTTTAPVNTTTAPTVTNVPPTNAPTTAPPTTTAPTTAPPTTTPPTTKPPTTTTTKPSNAPVIKSFTGPSVSPCSAYTVKLSWEVTGANHVVLAVDPSNTNTPEDMPFNTVGSKETNYEVPFSCPKTHDYWLIAIASDGSKTRSHLTVAPLGGA